MAMDTLKDTATSKFLSTYTTEDRYTLFKDRHVVQAQETADKIMQALLKEFQKEPLRHVTRIPNPSNNKLFTAAPKKTIVPMDGYKNRSQNKPDIEKLKALLS